MLDPNDPTNIELEIGTLALMVMVLLMLMIGGLV